MVNKRFGGSAELLFLFYPPSPSSRAVVEITKKETEAVASVSLFSSLGNRSMTSYLDFINYHSAGIAIPIVPVILCTPADMGLPPLAHDEV